MRPGNVSNRRWLKRVAVAGMGGKRPIFDDYSLLNFERSFGPSVEKSRIESDRL